MLLLQATNIQKSYGVKTVLDFARLDVYEGDKIGIVGANGAGKSTLLGILSRELPPDRGSVSGDWQVCYIRQLDAYDPNRSGGENAKASIRSQTINSGQILFADEPTANLDADGQVWVRQKLQEASTVLLISHDRQLLDDICTRIVVVDGSLTEYTGNFSDYEAALEQKRRQHEQSYDSYQRKKRQLEAAVQSREHLVASMKAHKKSQYNKNSSEARLRGDKRASKYKKAERQSTVLFSRLEHLDKVEKLREPPAIRIDFSLTKPPENKHVITCGHLHYAYGEKVIFDDVSFVVPNRAKIAVTGKNGAGKSTLLRLIHEGGSGIITAPKLRWGFLYQTFAHLDMERSVLDNVRSTSIQDHAAVRSVLAGLLFFGDEAYKPAGTLSGGEKMRLSLAKLLTCEANALLLDEPTNFLDLRAVEAVENMIRQYPGTVLVVSHDARFIEGVTDSRLHIENGCVTYAKDPDASSVATAPAQKILLEMRLTRLVSEISAAPPEIKTVLERQYQDTLSLLRCL